MFSSLIDIKLIVEHTILLLFYVPNFEVLTIFSVTQIGNASSLAKWYMVHEFHVIPIG